MSDIKVKDRALKKKASQSAPPTPVIEDKPMRNRGRPRKTEPPESNQVEDGLRDKGSKVRAKNKAPKVNQSKVQASVQTSVIETVPLDEQPEPRNRRGRATENLVTQIKEDIESLRDDS